MTDEAVAVKLIRFCGGVDNLSYSRPARGRGKDRVDAKLRGLNAGVRYGRPVLVLRDLDEDAACAGQLVATLVPERHGRLVFRICEPSVDAWLLADAAAYARYCGIPARALPSAPESGRQFKSRLMMVLEGRAGRFRAHVQEARRRNVPDWASFGEWQSRFAREHWDAGRAIASGASASLQRAARALRSVASAAG